MTFQSSTGLLLQLLSAGFTELIEEVNLLAHTCALVEGTAKY